MEVLTLGGKQFVKASKAAKDLGYASDYVGQLCRSGAVEAHLVGRTWYVNVDTLGAHRVDKKRNARVKAREYAKKSIEEARLLSVQESTNKAQNIAIHYEKDDEELIPDVKHVPVASPKQVVTSIAYEGDRRYEILNANKKVVMSGKINVVDAEEESVLTDVTILTPKLVRSKREHHTTEEVRQDLHEDQTTLSPVSVIPDAETEASPKIDSKPISFRERLEAYSNDSQEVRENSLLSVTEELPVQKDANTTSIFAKILRVALVTLLLASLGLNFVEKTYHFHEGTLYSGYEFSVPNAKNLYKI